MPVILLPLMLLCTTLALWLFARFRRNHAVSGTIYTGVYKQRLQRPMVSRAYGVAGKPPYVIDHDGWPIPVLAKQGAAPGNEPHDSHVAQVLTYCSLIHETVGEPPPYGIIRYQDRTFEVDYNESSVQALLDLIDEIRASTSTVPARSHNERRRCFACRHRRKCDDSLVG